MARRKKRSATQRQVDLEANVRFGPQRRALSDLLSEAYETLRTTAASEESAARGIRAAVNAGKPQITRIYSNAFSTQDQANADVNRDLSMLSAAADPFRAVSAREAGGAKRRLAESLAGASKELVDREVQAEQGRAFAVTNAVQKFRGDVQKVKRQQEGLAQDIGAYKSATYGSLKAAQAEAEREAAKERREYQLKVDALGLDARRVATQERKAEADLTGRDPVTGKRVPGKGKPKSKFRAGGLAKHQKILEGVQDANAIVRRLRRGGASFQDIGRGLTLPKNKDNPWGGYGPITARAAVELARDGRLSGGTYRTLKSRGLLGHRAPKGWKPPKPTRVGRQIKKHAPKSLW